MLALSLVFDGLTLFFLFAYALSAIVSLLPNRIIHASPGEQVREARRRLLLPPIGAAVLVGIGLGPIDGISVHPWFHLVSSSIGESTHDFAAIVVLIIWGGLITWHAYQWGRARGYLNLLRILTAPVQKEALHRILAEAQLEWPGEIQIIECKLPLCFVLGHSRLILSAVLIEELAPEQILAIVAHELSHVKRRDNLWRLILQGAQLAHLPLLGQREFRQWAQCAELACDEAASKQVGAVCLAQTLVSFQRLINQCGLTSSAAIYPGSAFGGALNLQTRVEWLLDPTPVQPSSNWLTYWPQVLLLIVLTQVPTIHICLEHLLELLHG